MGLFLMSANAQNYWQVMIPDFGAPKEVYKRDSLLYVFTLNFNNGNPWLYVYDLNGNFQYSKGLLNLGAGYFMKNHNDTGYVMVGGGMVDSVIYRKLIYYNSNLDAVWTFSDSSIYPISSGFSSIALLNNIIACKYIIEDMDIYPYGTICRYCIFDYQGNLIYDNISPFDGYLFSLPNNLLLTMQQITFYGKTKYFLTDSLLNIIDSVTISKQTEGDRILVNSDGSIIAYASGLYSLNNNLDLIWSKPISDIYNGSGTPYYAHDIQLTINNGVAFGGCFHYDFHDMGYLFNLDENLDVINNNIYSYFPADWVHRLIPLNDGTFILLVSAENLSGRTWLFRTHLDGSVTIDEKLYPKQVQVFPNPVVNEVKVEFGEPVSGNIIISNIIGKQVWNSEFSDAHDITIPVEQMEPGVYILTVSSGNNHFTGKICKQ